MVRTTILARVSDGMPLAASMDDEKSESEMAEAKGQAKMLFKKLNDHSEPRCTIESGNFTFQYVPSNVNNIK